MAAGVWAAGLGWAPLPDSPMATGWQLVLAIAAGVALYAVALALLWLGAGRPAGAEADMLAECPPVSRICLVGAGFISGVHADAIASLPGRRVSAVVDPNMDAAGRLARAAGGDEKPSVSILYNPEVRGYVYQAVTVLILGALVIYAWTNAAENLARANMTAGFGFLAGRAGFDLAQSLIAYSSDSTYLQALEVGLLNTLLVAACGIVTATVIGLLVGIGRLSSNWLIARICTVYVEIFRNIPPLLVIFFWYKGVLSLLPDIKKALNLPFSIYISNRGIYVPTPMFG
eukprot:gene11514-15384_t